MNLTGTVFAGKYRLEKLIGEGAFGKIYLGTFFFRPFSYLFLGKSLHSSQEVAVKLVLILYFLAVSEFQ